MPNGKNIFRGIVSVLLPVCMYAADGVAQPPPSTGPSALTEGPATAPSVSAVPQLIIQLGSDRAQDRDAAQARLTDLGPAAVPDLKKAADNADDPEIRSRAGEILAALKDREATQPSLITLHAQAMPVQQALDTIGAQSGSHLLAVGLAVPSPARPAKTVTLDADQKPFWEVMPDVCRQLRIAPDLDYHVRDSMRFTPAWADWINQSPHQIVGPYWIGVKSISHLRTMEPGISDVPQESFNVGLIVLGEPKLDVTHMSDFVVTEASDNAGHSLMPKALPSNMPRALLRRADSLDHLVQFGLSYPQEQPGSLIATLSGDLVIVAAQDFKQYEVDDVMGSPKITNPLTSGEFHVTVARKGDHFEAQIQCNRQTISDDQWAAVTNHMGDVVLEDAAGHAMSIVDPVTIHSLGQSPGNENFRASGLFKAQSPGEPRKLKWTFPGSVKAIKVSVTFHDLKMP